MTYREFIIKRIEEEREVVSSSKFRAKLAIATGKIPPVEIKISLLTFAVIRDALNLARLKAMKKEKIGFHCDDYELALIELIRDNDLELSYTQLKANYKLDKLNEEEN